MSNPTKGWIGVDLDGTLVEYTTFKGPDHLGEPLLPMVEKIKQWLKDGIEVRIFTARVSEQPSNPHDLGNNIAKCRVAIHEFCLKHFGKELPITCCKDYACIAIYDDRAIQMIPNTGVSIQEYLQKVL